MPDKMSLDYLRLLYGEFQKYEVTLIDALPAWGCLITGGNSVRNSRIWLWIFGRIVLAPYSSFGDACQQGIMLWLSTWRKWQICPWLQVVTCSRFPISIARSPLTLWLNFDTRLWQRIHAGVKGLSNSNHQADKYSNRKPNIWNNSDTQTICS